jgi:hypothetical protein
MTSDSHDGETEMKPFNLEAALVGEPIVTRKGHAAKIVAYVPEASVGFRVVAFIEDGEKLLTWHNEEGVRCGGGVECDDDLFMKEKTKIVWVNFYNNDNACYYNTEEDADSAQRWRRAARIGNKAYRVEIEI